MLLLLLRGADAPDPPEPLPQQSAIGGAWLTPIQRPAVDTSAADRDMRDIQTIITALFALNRIF